MVHVYQGTGTTWSIGLFIIRKLELFVYSIITELLINYICDKVQ